MYHGAPSFSPPFLALAALRTRLLISIVVRRSRRWDRAALAAADVAAAALQGVTDAAADPRELLPDDRPDKVLTPVLPSGGAGEAL